MVQEETLHTTTKDLIILPLKATDLDQLPALQPSDWSDILPVARFYISSPFCFPIKVMNGERIAGIGTSIVHGDTAWLALIIVHPEYRNRGIGTLITQTLIDRLSNVGCTTILLVATQLGTPIYQKLGFEADQDYVFYKREQAAEPPRITPLHSSIRPMEAHHIHEVLHMDRMMSGEMRQAMLQDHFDKGLVYLRNDHVAGFYLPSLGEGPVVADHEAAGLALLHAKISTMNMTVLPEHNPLAHEFVQQHHFREWRRGTRMWLGKKIEWEPAKLYSRIGGHVG